MPLKVQQQRRAALAQLEETETTEDQTEEAETATTFNESFEIEVKVLKPVKKQLTKGRRVHYQLPEVCVNELWLINKEIVELLGTK